MPYSWPPDVFAILKRTAQMFNHAGCLPNGHRNKYDVSVTCGVGYVVRRLVDHPQRQRMLDICATPPYTDYSINNVCAFKRRSQRTADKPYTDNNQFANAKIVQNLGACRT